MIDAGAHSQPGGLEDVLIRTVYALARSVAVCRRLGHPEDADDQERLLRQTLELLGRVQRDGTAEARKVAS